MCLDANVLLVEKNQLHYKPLLRFSLQFSDDGRPLSQSVMVGHCLGLDSRHWHPLVWSSVHAYVINCYEELIFD